MSDIPTKLIDFINQDNKLIPPYIGAAGNTWFLYDGFHRICLSNYLNINAIPFLIDKSNLLYLKVLK